jgi:hypothetical protein
VRYAAPNGRYYFGAFVRNIEGKLKITGPLATEAPVPGSQAVGITDPRTWGIATGLTIQLPLHENPERAGADELS